GHLSELGADKARRDRRYAHAASAELLGEGFGEAEHERFARRVEGEVGHRLEGHLRRDVDDPTAPQLHHWWEETVRQRDKRFKIEAQESRFQLRRRRSERAVGCCTGVVDEQFDLALTRCRDQRLDSVRSREIGDEWLEPAAVRRRKRPRGRGRSGGRRAARPPTPDNRAPQATVRTRGRGPTRRPSRLPKRAGARSGGSWVGSRYGPPGPGR